MSKISIAGATTGTGTFTLASPATNVDRVLTLPDEAGTVLTSAGVPASAMPAGSVIQVVSTTKTNTETMANSVYADVSGLSVSVTPTSTSSKILVLVNAHINPLNSQGVQWQLVRGTTSIAVNNTTNPSTGGAYTDTGGAAGNIWIGTGVTYLDSPATTSETTYKVQSRSTGGGTYGVNRRTIANDFGGISSITVMEIAA